MARIMDGRFVEGMTRDVSSFTDRAYYSVDAMTDSYDYEVDMAYLSAEGNVRHAWRDLYDEDEYGIDPYDFETENEYLEAVEEI